MKTVVCDPEPFGFGPSADIFCVVKELKRCRSVRVVVLATAQQAPIFEKEKGLEIQIMEYPRDAEKFKGIVNSADVYVTATNDDNLKAIRDAGIKTPVVYIDSLLWYWGDYKTPFTDYQRSADLYLACNYFDTAAVLKRNKNFFKNIRLIPPIISGSRKGKTKDQLLVNFGGLTSIFTTQEDANEYADLICRIFFHNLRLQEKFGKVFVSGNKYVMQKMAELNHAKNMVFLSLDHEVFIRLLKESKFFLTNPGIHALYEGYANDVPTVGFFPSNLTQELQLRFITKTVDRKHIMNWGIVDKDFRKKMSEDPARQAESIMLIKGYVKLLRNDEELYDAVIHKLNRDFSNINTFLERIRKQQKRHSRNIELDGAKKVVYYMKKQGFI